MRIISSQTTTVKPLSGLPEKRTGLRKNTLKSEKRTKITETAK